MRSQQSSDGTAGGMRTQHNQRACAVQRSFHRRRPSWGDMRRRIRRAVSRQRGRGYMGARRFHYGGCQSAFGVVRRRSQAWRGRERRRGGRGVVVGVDAAAGHDNCGRRRGWRRRSRECGQLPRGEGRGLHVGSERRRGRIALSRGDKHKSQILQGQFRNDEAESYSGWSNVDRRKSRRHRGPRRQYVYNRRCKRRFRQRVVCHLGKERGKYLAVRNTGRMKQFPCSNRLGEANNILTLAISLHIGQNPLEDEVVYRRNAPLGTVVESRLHKVQRYWNVRSQIIEIDRFSLDVQRNLRTIGITV